jgi:hypothetical protein
VLNWSPRMKKNSLPRKSWRTGKNKALNNSQLKSGDSKLAR